MGEREQPRPWASIEDLPASWHELASPNVHALVRAWIDRAAELEQSDNYKTFLVRLRRQWAIETGVLEDLYTLSEGATKTLIEKGLDAALIGHQDTDQSPQRVVDLIHDQYSAIEGLYAFVSGERPLTKSYLLELHQVLTAHQDTHEAIDSLGHAVRVPMKRGVWKQQPNAIGRVACAPPEQVETEIERLLALHGAHAAAQVPPDVEAAWIHHRFSLIHPFADGNGRIARCLSTLVLLKARWFPLVITRDDRVQYIGSLREADAGDLRGLVVFFGKLQERAIRHAFGLSEHVMTEGAALQGILASVRAKFSKRRADASEQMKRVAALADSLQHWAQQRLSDVAAEIGEALAEENKAYRAFAWGASSHQANAHFNKFQIVRCAKALGYYANTDVFRAWTALVVDASARTEVLFSFHGMGQTASGIIACSAMAYTKQPSEDGETAIGDIHPLAEDPFSFGYAEDPHQAMIRFQGWFEDCLLRGLSYWRDVV